MERQRSAREKAMYKQGGLVAARMLAERQRHEIVARVDAHVRREAARVHHTRAGEEHVLLINGGQVVNSQALPPSSHRPGGPFTAGRFGLPPPF